MDLHLTEKSPRTVYGKDLVVVYAVRRDFVSVYEICGGRFTLEEMKDAIGISAKKEVLLFVKNNNLHDAQDGLRGVLMLVNHRIGVVVKTVGSYILFQVFLPTREAGSFRVIDLRIHNRRYGFYLQQVFGSRVGTLTCAQRMREMICGYPYSRNSEHIYMNPDGPDFLVPAYKSEVPTTMWKRFERLPDNLSTKTYCDPCKKIVRLRKSETTNVVYVKNHALIKGMGNKADHFFVPCGVPHEERDCPWPSRDGKPRRYGSLPANIVQTFLFVV